MHKYLRNFPINIKRSDQNTEALKNPKATPITSPINGNQESKANHEPYFCIPPFQESIVSCFTRSFFNHSVFPTYPIPKFK